MVIYLSEGINHEQNQTETALSASIMLIVILGVAKWIIPAITTDTVMFVTNNKKTVSFITETVLSN
jgi:hypothetical protein